MSAPSPAVAAALERWRSRLRDLSRQNPLPHLAAQANERDAFRDLAEGADRFAAHPLLRALAGDKTVAIRAETDLPDEQELDAAQPPERTFPVLDADASQRRCLEAAARGQSFVLLGAPGTGKSQTIVNLVAACLAEGKTVLCVSAKKAALAVVARRLGQVGLGDYCLDLSGPLRGNAEVGIELQNNLERPRRTQSDEATGAERLRRCRDRLAAYTVALHQPRELLQHSAWWALGELARCHDLPALPLRLAEGTEMTATWLEDGRQALRRAGELWHIRQDPDFPWRGFKLERYHKQLRDEVIGLVEKAQARQERLLAVAGEYAKQVEAEGPVPWLLRLADLLESSPHPPAAWLNAADPQQPARDVERGAEEHQHATQERGPLEARYGPSIWQLSEGTAATLTDTWRQVQPLLARGDERGERFLKHQQHLRGWVADTLRRIPGWLTEARVLEKWLGLALPVGTAARPGAEKHAPPVTALRRLLRLANLCQTDTPPERSWVMAAAALEQARELLARQRPAFTAYRQGKAALLERYTEAFFELDLERLGTAYAGPYRSWWRIFSGQFRRDRRALRRRTRTGILARTLANDMVTARDLLLMKRRLEEDGAQRRPVLGRYERGLDTDLDAAERATRVAAEAIELVQQLGCSAVPDRLADALTGKGAAAEKGRAAARRLHDSLAAWWQHTQELQGVLPLNQVPDTGRPLEEVALSALLHYAQQLQGPLNHFAALADPVLGRAVAPPPDALTLLTDLAQVERQRGAAGTDAAGEARWRERLGPGFQGGATDWTALRRAAAWTQRLRALFDDRPPATASPVPLPAQIVRIATGQAPAPSSRELRAAREQRDHALHSLEIRFEPPGPTWAGKRLAELSPPELQPWLRALRERAAQLAGWADWRNLQRRFEHLGLAAFWEELQKAEAPAERLPELFLKAALASWLEKVYQEDPALGSFRRADHERLLEEFRELDREALRQAAETVACRAEKRRFGPGEPSSKLDADLLLRLKPCVLLHPLAVNTYLPAGQFTFDMVIFDEASQVPIEEAASAISRGRQVVLSGDDRQLPPGPASSGAGDIPQSVLQAGLSAALPVYRLACHYRSRKEGLFAFANQHFYEARLATFPAADGEPGIHFHHVPEGVSTRGVNPGEAAVVADLVVAHLRAHGDKKSLGVVTFAPAQATAVADEVERRLGEQPALAVFCKAGGTEGFFIKPAVAVQGDERDVIFLSPGFGRDSEGRPPLDFGPLSQEGGEPCLNVAVTRSREQMVVVTSLRAADLASMAASSPGVALLRDFLAYAENGPPVPKAEELPALVGDVAAEVRRLGYEVVPNLGRGSYRLELGIPDPDAPDRFLLGIECDGPAYEEAPTVRDRDRLRPEALRARGWQLHRIWAPAWVGNREEEVGRLRQALQEARAGAAEAPAQHPEPMAPTRPKAPRDGSKENVKLTQ